MRRSFLVFALVALSAPTFLACSSADSESGSSSVLPTVSEPVSYEASEDTRRETGVVVWGGDDRDGVTRVVGYDEHGATIATLEHREVPVDPQHHYFET